MFSKSFDPSLLDDPREIQRDACGVGFVAHMRGEAAHSIVLDGLQMLDRMDHRGGRTADELMSDGAGALLQIPHKFFQVEAQKRNSVLPPAGEYSVGMFFLPRQENEAKWWLETIADVAEKQNLKLVFQREVPLDLSVLSPEAKESCPLIHQFFFTIRTERDNEKTLEHRAFFLRKALEKMARIRYGQKQLKFYIASLSHESVVYKALTLAKDLGRFYPDLRVKEFTSAYALVHLRFSTNTLPAWPLAQPFRMICHNGEINTLRGNINAMHARSHLLEKSDFSSDFESLLPICTPGLSDSSMLDNTLEFLVTAGRSLTQALTMVVPEPWEKNHSMPEELKNYYEYQSYLMEPWDGPALIGFARGAHIGAILDRNGLRPGRYCITTDERVIVASEAGVLDLFPEQIVEKGRIAPGRIFMLDMSAGRIVPDPEIKQTLARQKNYGAWLQQERRSLALPTKEAQRHSQVSRKDTGACLRAFGYTQEDLEKILAPMANDGKEPEGSMGNDTPLAVLSQKKPLLFNFFRQLFAQVTNPPIDAIRKEMVTSLSSFLGGERNLLGETPEHCRVIRIPRPILNSAQMALLDDDTAHVFKPVRVSLNRPKSHFLLAEALETLNAEVSRAVALGSRLVILSDAGLDEQHLALPSLLAVASVHHSLIRSGQRKQTSIVIESGEPREVHHFATLLGYGADAIHPWLALDLVAQAGPIQGLAPGLSPDERVENYTKAICDGILKVMSKMGISTLQSYRGAQIFESLGLDQDLVNAHFTWTPNRIQGISLLDIENDIKERHQQAFSESNDSPSLRRGGTYRWLRDEERHLHHPEMIARLQNAVRINSKNEFKAFCKTIDDCIDQPLNLRALLKFKQLNPSISIDDVEPVERIMTRFATGAMSFGSISQEAHETIAVAMNSIGARSNSGEGGEDPDRFHSGPSTVSKSSKIKQVASARFGVTMDYLVHAEELQIKIAQGAKPGEGGQLPGHKVNPTIAKVRHSVPGITLISPPPHHDIYSIEDLAQLIYDLKNANEHARISVKLVSESGVGTIATGVAKAKADVILISGHEGGTGSSPLSSISHAGLPWELGLAETHRTLVENNYRSRVVLQVDGQLRTPRDVAIATLLGAEEWGIATGALISLGCIMMRKCHLNTCPVGIATHDPELRKRFSGQPEHLINYVYLLSEGLREIMAELGFRTVEDMVGQVDRLEQVELEDALRPSKIDLSEVLKKAKNNSYQTLYHSESQSHSLETTLDHRFLVPQCLDAAMGGANVEFSFNISNLQRSVGTILSSALTRRIYPEKLQPESIHLTFNGSAGQSFMAFAIQGIKATLRGEANDYLGKGLSGATLVVVPPAERTPRSGEIILGNTALYGATSGEVFIRGAAGERFAVRNSGASAVVEGVGHHGCEYMTGGCVVVLGQVGINFAAGMSGGISYIYDPNHTQRENIANANIEVTPLEIVDDELELKALLTKHVHCTQSPIAEFILESWQTEKCNFLVAVPAGFRTHLQTTRANKKLNSSRFTQVQPQGGHHGRAPRIHELPSGYTTHGTGFEAQTTFP